MGHGRVADQSELGHREAPHETVAKGKILTVTLITGGARSGKSLHAEKLALAGEGRPFYLATAQVEDPEMAARVALHRARRGALWQEREAGLDLVAALEDCEGPGVRLVDCLTLWLSHLMWREADVAAHGAALAAWLAASRAEVVLVTSEVGLGIVPENALARAYRDQLGLLNQSIAGVADRVDLVIAGQVLRIKG